MWADMNCEINSKFAKKLKESHKLEWKNRVETWEILIEVLREAIINAFIHRVYLIPSFTYIKISDTKVVISNLETLPKSLTIPKLFKEQKSILRNKQIVKIFYYTGLIDTWGRGISNIINYLKKKLQKPKFPTDLLDFSITFQRKNEDENKSKNANIIAGINLSNLQKEIIFNIIKSKNITANNLNLLLNKDLRAIERNIKKLKEKGILQRIVANKGGYWKINK